MTDLENKSSDQLQFLANFLQGIPNIEKSNIPKVNLKKVKLSKFQNLEQKLKNKNLTTIRFNDSLFNIIDSGTKPSKDNIPKEEGLSTSPLRKKDNKREKDITFNLEAQVIQDDENIILSPSMVTMPPLEEDSISSSGSEVSYVWPQKNENKKLKRKKKKKTYFINDTEKEENKNKLKINFDSDYEKHKKEIEEISSSAFPWSGTESEENITNDVFTGGLESELIDDLKEEVTEKNTDIITEEEPVFKMTSETEEIEPTNNTETNNETNFDSSIIPTYKAIHSNIAEDLLIDIKNMDFTQNSIEFQGKASSMNDKSGPVKIILLGGLTLTLAYMLWTNVLPELENFSDSNTTTTEEKIVVRDLFSKENRLKAKSIFERVIKPKRTNESEIKPLEENNILENTLGLIPISKEDRLSLIERAKTAVEFRRNPFGQEEVLPADFFLEKKKKEEEAAKPLPDIELLRKQVELVGVISTREKDLALVNVYTADYGVRPDDDKETRETKLKAALAMAIPNRLEVSLLDPVEDWYVKQIFKSKSRSEDPTLDLVKGDKKFKLRVGQKLLLPEEKKTDEE